MDVFDFEGHRVEGTQKFKENEFLITEFTI